MNGIKGWKTVAFGVLLAVLAIFSSPDMQAWAAQYIPELGVGAGTIIIILRALTSSPIFKREANDAPKNPSRHDFR